MSRNRNASLVMSALLSVSVLMGCSPSAVSPTPYKRLEAGADGAPPVDPDMQPLTDHPFGAPPHLDAYDIPQRQLEYISTVA